MTAANNIKKERKRNKDYWGIMKQQILDNQILDHWKYETYTVHIYKQCEKISLLVHITKESMSKLRYISELMINSKKYHYSCTYLIGQRTQDCLNHLKKIKLYSAVYGLTDKDYKEHKIEHLEPNFGSVWVLFHTSVKKVTSSSLLTIRFYVNWECIQICNFCFKT